MAKLKTSTVVQVFLEGMLRRFVFQHNADGNRRLLHLSG